MSSDRETFSGAFTSGALIEASAISTREQALEHALDWAVGRRSWINVAHADTQERRLEVVAVLDAQEVVKWAALAQALPSEAGRAD